MGYYDEALSLIRSVGEIANLLSLFELQTEAFARWKTLDERARRQQFKPYIVREQLAKAGTPIRVSDETYGELSGKNVHVTPATSPQSYNAAGQPTMGGYYQPAGFLTCQNELAVALTFTAYAAAKLTHLDQVYRQRLLIAARDLIANTGSLGVTNIDEMWRGTANDGDDG